MLLFRELHRWQHMTYTIKVCKFHSWTAGYTCTCGVKNKAIFQNIYHAAHWLLKIHRPIRWQIQIASLTLNFNWGKLKPCTNIITGCWNPVPLVCFSCISACKDKLYSLFHHIIIWMYCLYIFNTNFGNKYTQVPAKVIENDGHFVIKKTFFKWTLRQFYENGKIKKQTLKAGIKEKV